MTTPQAIISGVVQGITEFFPISSSGHLVILHSLFGVREETVAFDVFLHFGTLISIVVFFRKDIINMLGRDRKMLKFILAACVPTFIMGILFKDAVEALFSNVRFVGAALIATGIFLLFASLSAICRKSLHKTGPLGMVNSIVIGIAQGIAIVPGISRSGSTIGTALIAGLDEETSLKFSFLLALPVILGANLLKARHIYGNLVSIDTIPFIAGGAAAAITGFLAIKAMFGILRKNMFFLFGIYCILAGASVIILLK